MAYEEFISDATEQIQTQSDLSAEFEEASSFESQLDEQPTLEASFAQRIDSMSLEDLRNAREELTQMGFGTEDELADQHAAQVDQQRHQQEFEQITGNLTLDQLSRMREEFAKGNDELADVFGLNDSEEEGGFQKSIPFRQFFNGR